MARGAAIARSRAHVSSPGRGVCSSLAVPRALRQNPARALHQLSERVHGKAPGNPEGQSNRGMARVEDDGLPEDLSGLGEGSITRLVTSVPSPFMPPDES